MKHMLRNVLTLSLVLVMAAGFTGCGNKIGDIELKQGTNAIYIDEDGVVSYGVGESFKSDDYDKDTLEKYIDEEVADYNSSDMASVEDAIEVERFDIDDDVAYLVLKIATVYDFNEYMQEYNKEDKDSFYAGQISDKGSIKIKGNFVSPDKKKTVKGTDIKTMTENEILILNDQYTVQIDGDVKYISENCKISEDGMITTAKSEDGLSYIVYK